MDALLDRGPSVVGDVDARGTELLCQLGADAEADEPLGAAVALRIGEPLEHGLFVERTVSPKEALLHRLRQRGEAVLDERQVTHARGDVAVAELVAEHEVGLHPVEDGRLNSTASLVVRLCILLVALDHGRIVIERRACDPILRRHGVSERHVDETEARKSVVLAGDIGNLVALQFPLRLFDQRVVVERVEVRPEDRLAGQRCAKQPLQALVGA